jgi:hypothetical protein
MRRSTVLSLPLQLVFLVRADALKEKFEMIILGDVEQSCF